MAVNKVCIGDETIIDLSTDSLETSDQVANGVTAHNRFGEQLIGTGGDPLYDYPIGGSYCNNTATGFHLADGITNIRDYAFYERSALTSIYVPSSVTRIGVNAFYECSNITAIGDLSGVILVCNHAFYECVKLTAIDLPNAINIDDSAFLGCDTLASISIPQVTSIGSRVFAYCDNLTLMEIKNGVIYTPYLGNFCKIAKFNNHLYWQNGVETNDIYVSLASTGSPTRTKICTLTSSKPSYSYTDGDYIITFARTGTGNNFSVSWTTSNEGDEIDAVQ